MTVGQAGGTGTTKLIQATFALTCIWKVQPPHLLALCSLLDNLSLDQTAAAGVLTRVMGEFGGHSALWTSQDRRYGSFGRHHQDGLLLPPYELLLLFGWDRDRTAKKNFNMTTRFLSITSSWSGTKALHLPHLSSHKPLQLWSTLDSFSYLWQWQKISGY